MMKLSVVEFARLSGVDHATISRMIRDKRLLNNGGLNPDDLVSKSYLTGRFIKIQSDAEVFGKIPRGWTFYYIERDGCRLPFCLFYEVKRADYRKIIRLRFYSAFSINDDSETVTEKTTGKVYPVESVEG